MSDSIENQQSPEDIPLNLKGSLNSFMGTEIASLIKESLAAEGLNPNTYELESSGHENYHGFPVTESIEYGDEDATLSPIIAVVGERIEQGKLALDTTANKTVRLKPWIAPQTFDPNAYSSNAYKLSKLESASLEGLVDIETGTVIAYAVALSSDGGKPGHVLISTNDVEPIQKTA